MPPIADRASRMAYDAAGRSRTSCAAAPIPDSPAPTIRTSTCSISLTPASLAVSEGAGCTPPSIPDLGKTAPRHPGGAYLEPVTQTQTVEFTSWLTDKEFGDAWVSRRRSLASWRRWVRWGGLAGFAFYVARAVASGDLGFVVIYLPVGVMIAMLTSDWAARRGARRTAQLNPELTNPQRLTLRSDGITIVTSQSTATRTWPSFSSWQLAGRVLVLNATDKYNGLALYLGRGDADDHTWAAALDLLTERLGAPRT